MLTDSVVTNLARTRAFGRLEPCDGKLASTVLRGGPTGNGRSFIVGKCRNLYEFDDKVGLAMTLKGNLIVSARSFPGNQYEGHTMHEQIKHWVKDKRLTDEDRRMLKRRQAIEPIIGHHKTGRHMDLCHLKGLEGNAIHALLCPADYNIRRLLRMIAKKGLGLLLCLLQAAILMALMAKLNKIIDRKRLQSSDQRRVLA